MSYLYSCLVLLLLVASKIFMNLFYSLMPEIFFFICILLFFCYGICFSVFRNLLYIDVSKGISYIIMLSCLCGIVLEINAPVYCIGYLFHKSHVGMLLSVFLLCVSTYVHPLLIQFNVTRGLSAFEYGFLFFVVLFSSVSILHTHFLLLIYLLLELQNISLYVLTSFHKTNGNSNESGLKYFILSSFSSIIFLFGVSLLYSSFGSLHLYDVRALLLVLGPHVCSAYQELGAAFITLGLLFKLYCVPFHFWVPDVYHGSPTSTTVVLACIAYVSTFYVFVQVVSTVSCSSSSVLDIVMYFFIFLCLIVGGIGGVYQSNVKRLLAYSSISMIGYLLSSLLQSDIFSVSDTFYFIVNYVCSVLGIFVVLFATERRVRSRLNLECTAVEHFSGMFVYNKHLSFLIGLLFFSLSGIPPFTGFFTKYAIIENGVRFEEWLVVFSMLFNSVCSCYFYVKVVRSIYYDLSTFSSSLVFSGVTYRIWYFLWSIVIVQVGGLYFTIFPYELFTIFLL